ncbi:MAG: tricarballylate utilization 4Fe-4S protein TcuB [Arenicella sp.]
MQSVKEQQTSKQNQLPLNEVGINTQSTLAETIQEARRQVEICNACRYCEGYCSVFPAITRERTFNEGDITQLANLCHNCRGCYHACQYTEPHEFSLNLPKVLAEVRQGSWEDHAFPQLFGKAFHRYGLAIALAAIVGFALLMWIVSMFEFSGGEGFYAVLPHNAMVALFMPAFLLPLLSIAISIQRYWLTIGGGSITFQDVSMAFGSVAKMKNLSGGHGDGCNFENEDEFSHRRRWLHQCVMYGFLLCFASTSAGTVMHYFFNLPAPYDLISFPKLFGVTGGILLSLGTLGMIALKLKAERFLSDGTVWSGEMGFIVLLCFVSTSGLGLYLFSESQWLTELLVLHLGGVLAFFLLTPYSKMVHGFFRLASLIKDEQIKRLSSK